MISPPKATPAPIRVSRQVRIAPQHLIVANDSRLVVPDVASNNFARNMGTAISRKFRESDFTDGAEIGASSKIISDSHNLIGRIVITVPRPRIRTVSLDPGCDPLLELSNN